MSDSDSLACCVDVPAGGALVRYAVEELLRGLGRVPVWTRRDDAVLVLRTDVAPVPSLALTVSVAALADLDAPRVPDVADLGRVEIDGEAWPVPVGAAGEATLGDAVAGAAWWLAGFQEAATDARDRHGRFPYARSLQAALGDAPGGPLRPAVDATRRALADALRQSGVEVRPRRWGRARWAVALTHDLDAVRTRRLRAGLGSLARGQVEEAARRAFGPDRRRDSIDDLREIDQRHGAQATWFVKPGAWTPEDIPGGLDQSLVDRLRRWSAEVGWHPGYGTLGHPERWAAERSRFEAAFGAPPALARTHFLRWADPETPRTLVGHGVRLDSTLGFAEHEGFRRGTAQPFRVFDRETNAATDLWEMPLAVMDTTLAEYRGLDSPALADALGAVFDAARMSGGCAVVLWHNQIDGETEAWRARLDALGHALGRARADGAGLGSLGRLFSGWMGRIP